MTKTHLLTVGVNDLSRSKLTTIATTVCRVKRTTFAVLSPPLTGTRFPVLLVLYRLHMWLLLLACLVFISPSIHVPVRYKPNIFYSTVLCTAVVSLLVRTKLVVGLKKTRAVSSTARLVDTLIFRFASCIIHRSRVFRFPVKGSSTGWWCLQHFSWTSVKLFATSVVRGLQRRTGTK